MPTTGESILPRAAPRSRCRARVSESGIALKRAFRLAVKGERLQRIPPIEMLKENNARRGFFEREQFEAVRRHLPEDLRNLVTVAYVTGWRIADELLPLEWRQVDFKAGTLRLEPGTTKNDEGRMFAMTPELRQTLDTQKSATDLVQRRTGRIIPWVFHRRGKPIKSFGESLGDRVRGGRMSGPHPA